MKTIKKYKDFNEGLISKGLEILNYKIVKENDKIAKKYLDMIYEDYGKPGEVGGNFPEYIEIEIMSIKEQLIK